MHMEHDHECTEFASPASTSPKELMHPAEQWWLAAQTATTPTGRPSHQALPALVSDLAGRSWMVSRIWLIKKQASDRPKAAMRGIKP